MAALSAAGYTLIALHRLGRKSEDALALANCAFGGNHQSTQIGRTRPYRNADALEHAANGGNVGVRLTASDLVVDVDPRNIDGGQQGMLPALKSHWPQARPFSNRADWWGWLAPLHEQAISSFHC